MSFLANSPLLRVSLIADRNQRLGAFGWQVLGGGASLLSCVPEGDEAEAFAALASTLPCFVDATGFEGLPAFEQTALKLAGVKPLALDALHTQQEPLLPSQVKALPPAVAWLHGAWYLQPPAQPSAAQVASRTQALALLEKVMGDADTRDLEACFRQDATLAYHLLRLVNSAGVGSQREITSFSQALLILGRQPLKRWLQLLLFAAREDDPRSAMLMAHVCLRSQGMERLAREMGADKADQDQAFMVGMFSMLGVLFGQPLATVLQPLQLAPSVMQALLNHHGEFGALLEAWEGWEAAQPAALHTLLDKHGIEVMAFNGALVRACAWTVQIVRGQGGGK
jgi:EAL and modified HD-GYP domain-containing signal transduction protein